MCNIMLIIYNILLFFIPVEMSFKGITYSKILLIYSVLVFGYLILSKKLEFKKISQNKTLKWITIAYICFCVSISISVVVNSIIEKKFILSNYFEILRIIEYYFIFINYLLLLNKENFKTFNYSIIVVIIFNIILSFSQFHNFFGLNELYIKTIAPTQYRALMPDYPTPRTVGLAGNPNVYGFFWVMFSLYFLNLIIKQPKKYYYYILYLFTVICVFQTSSRTSYIILIFSNILFFITNYAKLNKKNIMKLFNICFIYIIFQIVVLFALPNLYTWRVKTIIDYKNQNSYLQRVEKNKKIISEVEKKYSKESNLESLNNINNTIETQEINEVDKSENNISNNSENILEQPKNNVTNNSENILEQSKNNVTNNSEEIKISEKTNLKNNNYIIGNGPDKLMIKRKYYFDNEWLQIFCEYGVVGIFAFLFFMLSLFVEIKNNKKIDYKFYFCVIIANFINMITLSSYYSYFLFSITIIFAVIALKSNDLFNFNEEAKIYNTENKQKDKNKMKNILMIATYFPPHAGVGTVRVTKYVKYLKKFNWNPTVVTISEKNIKNFDDTLLKDIDSNVDIKKIDFNVKNNQKLENVFYKALKKNIDDIIKEKEYDAFFITGGPFIPMKIAPYIFDKFKIPYIIDLRDPWKLQKINKSNILIEIKSRISRFLIGFYEYKIFKNALAICTVNDTMTQQYSKEYPKFKNKFVTISNGYDKSDYEGIIAKKLDGFNIVYSGKFNVSAGFRDPRNLFKAIKNLNENGYNVKFIHVGNNEENVLKIAEEEEILKYCSFLGSKSYNESLQYCKAASILVVIGGNEKNEQTGKIFDYMGCQRPILALANSDSEINVICDQISHAYHVDKSDIKSIENVVINIYNKQDTEYENVEIKEYEREYLTKQLVQILEKVNIKNEYKN